MNDRNKIQWQHTLVLLALSGLLASCGLPPGMKLLHMRVHHGGECVLETNFDVPDSSTVSEIWEAAGRKPFSTQTAAESLGSNRANPLEAELTGPVEIRISHPASDQISAKLTNLTLQRSSADSDDWHLPAQEVKRAKKGGR
ncbi:MAG: hypothetical protein VX288_03665 [Planctomycetota bacterium]|nr:hypothetical protein [Planctomycetota bacterium]